MSSTRNSYFYQHHYLRNENKCKCSGVYLHVSSNNHIMTVLCAHTNYTLYLRIVFTVAYTSADSIYRCMLLAKCFCIFFIFTPAWLLSWFCNCLLPYPTSVFQFSSNWCDNNLRGRIYNQSSQQFGVVAVVYLRSSSRGSAKYDLCNNFDVISISNNQQYCNNHPLNNRARIDVCAIPHFMFRNILMSQIRLYFFRTVLCYSHLHRRSLETYLTIACWCHLLYARYKCD